MAVYIQLVSIGTRHTVLGLVSVVHTQMVGGSCG